MAIYRPPKARWPLALVVGVLCTAIGLTAGLVVASGDADPASVTEEVLEGLRGAAASLDVAGIEYAEAAEGGSATELRGSFDALASSRARYAEVSEVLVVLAPDRASTIGDLYDRLREAMEAGAPAAEVATLVATLDAALTEP